MISSCGPRLTRRITPPWSSYARRYRADYAPAPLVFEKLGDEVDRVRLRRGVRYLVLINNRIVFRPPNVIVGQLITTDHDLEIFKYISCVFLDLAWSRT